METEGRMGLEQIRAFLEASDGVVFKGRNRAEVYAWVNRTLREQDYQNLKRTERGLVRRYVEKMTGFSRAQTTRLITVYLSGEPVVARPYRRHRFSRRYTREDIALLVKVDEVHESLSGPATVKLLQRACYDEGDKRYLRLAEISVARLYRLRDSRTYRALHIVYQSTKPTRVAIGKRRKPEPLGRPG